MKKKSDYHYFFDNQKFLRFFTLKNHQRTLDCSYFDEPLKFLEQVIFGNHQQISNFLRQSLNLLTQKTTLTDSAGRTFKNITGFEYALWASDDLTLKIMIAFLQSKGKNCKFILLISDIYNAWCANGITYSYNGQEVNEHYFDYNNQIFKPMTELIAVLKHKTNTETLDNLKSEQTSAYLITQNNTSEQKNDLDNIWSKVVIGQKLLPMHMVYLYCCNRVFHPIGELSQHQPEYLRQFYDTDNKTLVDWFAKDISVTNHIIVKGCLNVATGIGKENIDFFSFIYLSMKRDLAALKKILNDKSQAILSLLNSLEQIPMTRPRSISSPELKIYFNCC